jgi:hypothetical protein
MGKRFIDKKKALRFAVMHRSQENETKEGESTYVLVPMNKYTANRQTSVVDKRFLYVESSKSRRNHGVKIEGGLDDVSTCISHPEAIDSPRSCFTKTSNEPTLMSDSHAGEILEGSSKKNLIEENITDYGDLNCHSAGEAAKYGIFFDDRDYDYTQHLRSIGREGAVYIEARKIEQGKSSGLWTETIECIKEAVQTADTGPKNELDDPEVKQILRVLQEDMEGPFDTYSLPDDLIELLNDSDGRLNDQHLDRLGNYEE